MKAGARFFGLLFFFLTLLFLCSAQAENRALLIGCDHFLSGQDTSPSSENNVMEMAQALSGGAMNLETLVTQRSGISGFYELRNLIDYTFSTAQDGDVSYFYISTHGLWEPGDPGNSMTLLLSNGRSQSGVTAQQLHDAFERIRGTKVLIVDACHAGAMIAKGIRDEFSHIFEGDSYKIICSSGGAEESWFWRGGATDEGVLAGGGYFSGVLSAGLSFQTGYAADENSDGSITLSEIKRYLRQMHGASTVHTYPEEDDFPILTYDASSVHRRTDGVGNIVFEEGLLSKEHREIAFSFTVYKNVRVAYQIVHQVDDRWDFEHAQIVYDTGEWLGGSGDTGGYLVPGRKERTITVSDELLDKAGYILFQMVVTQDQHVEIVASSAIGVAPEVTAAETLTVDSPDVFTPSAGEEMGFVISHRGPALISAVIQDEEGRTVRRLLSRKLTRPEQLYPEGTTLYWDGKNHRGERVEAGTYRLYVRLEQGGEVQEVLSRDFRLLSMEDTPENNDNA